jgi:acyl-CoA dehydrogenase
VTVLFTEEEQAFSDSVRDWCDRLYPPAVVRALDEKEEFPDQPWKYMSDAGFHGISIPEEYGGQGGDIATQVVLAQGLARTLAGLGSIWGTTSFAGAKSVGFYGSDEQKHRFLPEISAGNLKFAICITEPDGGTDLLNNMRTKASRLDGGWAITGQKVWSTGAHIADYLLLLARTEPDARPARAMTLFLVPTSAPGITMRLIPKLGFKAFGSNEVFLDDVHVADDLVLGERGGGWHHLVATLNNERILAAAFATGIIEGVLEGALEHLKSRSAFGRPIGQSQALQHYIADISTWRMQAQLLTLHAARLQAAGRPCAIEATMAKLAAAEHASEAADLGIQMLGGMGYALETDMQRYWRDGRIYRIAPVTSEMARNMIAESHGLPRSY